MPVPRRSAPIICARWRHVAAKLGLLVATTLAVMAATPAHAESPPEPTAPPAVAPPAVTQQPTLVPSRIGVAVDTVQILDRVGRFRVDVSRWRQGWIGGVLGGGSPNRDGLPRFNVVELGAQGGYFLLGDRDFGVGFAGQVLGRYGSGGRDEAEGSLPVAEVSTLALIAEAGIVARAAARSGLFAEGRWSYGWYRGTTTATQGATRHEDGRSYPRASLAIWLGWMI